MYGGNVYEDSLENVVWVLSLDNVDKKIKEDILADFFRRNKAEAIQMSIFEYDQELHNKTLLEEGIDIGITQGISQGITMAILIFLKKIGPVPDEVRQKIMSVTDEQILEQLADLTTEVKSIEEYSHRMNEILK